MSLQIFTHVKSYIDTLKSLIFVGIMLFSVGSTADWNVDFSRRAVESRRPASAETPAPGVPQKSIFEKVFVSSEPSQELVILNTERGFIPSSINVKEGVQYKVHVVNVNKNIKNVSFVMDAFSEHHATYYGKIKTFHIHPKRTGVYTFVSPETSAQGRLVVHPQMAPQMNVDQRIPASE